MNIKRKIESVFNIQQGEGLATVLLLIHSFLIGVTLAFYFAPANALFVREFGIKLLPHAYIASGIIGYITGYIYTRLQRKYDLSKIFTGALVFLLMLVTSILIGFKFTATKEITFLFFACLATVFSLSYLEFWGLALRMFNLRQGKRLFGLLSSGDIVSSIIGYISIPFIIPMLHDITDLLYIAVIGMLCSLVLLRIIIKKFPENLTISKTATTIVRPQPLPFSTLFKEKYFVLIFSVAALSMIAAYFTDYFFLSLTRIRFETKEELTKFIGLFFAMVKVVELIMSLISGRLLKQYGMKLGITLLPILIGGILLLAGFSGLAFGVTSSLFFIFISFNKLIERSVRKAIDGASFRILYQPLAPERQLDVQAKVDGIIANLAIILAGIVLLIFSVIPGATLVHLAFIFIVMVLFWFRRSFALYENYRVMLRTTLEDRSGTMKPIKSIHHVQEFLIDFMNKSNGQVTAIVQKLYNKLFPLSQKPLNLTNGYKTENEIKGTKGTSENLLTLAKSSSSSDREKAALLIGEGGRFQSSRIVHELLEDEFPKVKKAALVTAGKLRRSEFWHYLMEDLSSTMYGDSAASALCMAGLPVLPELERHFSRTGQSRSTLTRIVGILRSIGGKASIQCLRTKLSHQDKEVRHEVLNALAELGYHADKSEYLLLKQALEEEIENMVWTLATLEDLKKFPHVENLLTALRWEYTKKKERLYAILSLMYDSKTIGYIREIMENGSNSSRVYALEIIDITVSPELKLLLLPILEDLPPHECISALDLFFPQEQLSRNERLINIVFKDHSTVSRWTKACVLQLFGIIREIEFIDVLMAFTVSNDKLLSETAAASLWKISPQKLEQQFKENQQMFNSRLLEKVKLASEGNLMLFYDVVSFLKKTEYFNNVSESDIVDIAELTREIELSNTNTVVFNSENIEFCYWVISGEINSKNKNGISKVYTTGEFIGNILDNINNYENHQYYSVDSSRLLQINKYELYEPIINHIGIARSFIKIEIEEYS